MLIHLIDGEGKIVGILDTNAFRGDMLLQIWGEEIYTLDLGLCEVLYA